jgi:hypothetical protein
MIDEYLNYIVFSLCLFHSRDSSVGIATGYWLDDTGFDSRQKEDFSLLHSAQAGSGAYPTSYPMGTRSFFPEGKAGGRREADHSPPASAEVKNGGPIPHSPYVFMAQ